MSTSGLLVLVIAIILAIGISFIVRYILHERRFELHESGTRHVLKLDRNTTRDSDEAASFSSEQIEEIVKSKLAVYPDLQGTAFDFRTSSDGMLEIVFGENTYQDVSQIPDRRLREAIAEAVAEFNRT